MTGHGESRAKDGAGPRYIQARRYIERLVRGEGLEPGDQLPSERDLAHRLGVSQMTMNRAIQEMVREGLLYREVGRGTFITRQDGREKRLGTLALVSLSSPGMLKADPYGSGVLRGVQDAAAETGWDLLLMQQELNRPDGVSAGLRGRADGFLVISPPDEALPSLRRMRSDDLQMVSVGSSWLDEDIPAVDTDNRMGAGLVVRHLAVLGHTRIGFIGAPGNMSNNRDRHAGFCQALVANGLEHRDEWFISCACYWQMRDGERQALVRLARDPDGPTAFFAAGYVLAVSTMEILQSAGVRVPEDVSVVGFDDTFSAAFLNPPLTTVAQPVETMGRRAVERLGASIRAEAGAATVERLPTRLVVRRSTAPPA